jgi:hypothetical protein
MVFRVVRFLLLRLQSQWREDLRRCGLWRPPGSCGWTHSNNCALFLVPTSSSSSSSQRNTDTPVTLATFSTGIQHNVVRPLVQKGNLPSSWLLAFLPQVSWVPADRYFSSRELGMMVVLPASPLAGQSLPLAMPGSKHGATDKKPPPS